MSGEPTNCRDYLATNIRRDHPKWIVEASPAEPAQVRRDQPYVALWRTDINPGPTSLQLVHPMTIQLYGAKDGGQAAELELDATLDQLLLSLQKLTRFTFIGAERQLLKNVYQGWEITGSISTENVYRNALTNEKETDK